VRALASAAAAALAALLVLALGGLFSRRGAVPNGSSPVADAFVAGSLVLFAALALAAAAGAAWSAGPLLFLALAALAADAIRARRAPGANGSRRAASPGSARSRWASAVAALVPLAPAALAALVAGGLALAAFAAYRRGVTPDFFYHWGIKARRFLLARGPDLAFLARPENARLHPDYPLLAPELLLLPGLLRGAFDERGAFFWTPVWWGAGVLAFDALLAGAGIERRERALATATAALATAGVVLGHDLGTAPDLLIALAALAALPALVGLARGSGAEWRLGLAAGFAAAAKIEGAPLAAALVGAFLVEEARRSRAWPDPPPGSSARGFWS